MASLLPSHMQFNNKQHPEWRAGGEVAGLQPDRRLVQSHCALPLGDIRPGLPEPPGPEAARQVHVR